MITVLLTTLLGLALVVIVYFGLSKWKIKRFVAFVKRFLNKLKKKFFFYLKKLAIMSSRVLKGKKKRPRSETSDAKMDSDIGAIKLFEFKRIKPMTKSKRAALGIDESQGKYGVPTKRSGHRAVCNEDNLWIWGGYCPIEELNDEDDEVEDDVERVEEEQEQEQEENEENEENEELLDNIAREEAEDENEANAPTRTTKSPLFPEV